VARAVTAPSGARPGELGQALVEFSLVLPLFLLLLIGIFDFGRIVWARNALENAARESARFAIVHGGTVLTKCPIGPLDPTHPGADGACPAGGSPDTQPAKAVAQAWAIAAGDGFATTICYGLACSGDVSTDTNRRGAPVTVRTSSTIALIVPQLFRIININIGTISLDSSITMLVNT
jgi:hypothetical protein